MVEVVVQVAVVKDHTMFPDTGALALKDLAVEPARHILETLVIVQLPVEVAVRVLKENRVMQVDQVHQHNVGAMVVQAEYGQMVIDMLPVAVAQVILIMRRQPVVKAVVVMVLVDLVVFH
jgi:hypothetical protein